MANEEIAVGKEVLSYCGKCKLPLAHIIVSMKDETKIGKCECKTCSANHNYRDPEGVGKKKTKRGTKKEAVPVEKLWQEALSNAQGEPKAYSMDAKFEEGDLIDHPTFGKGVVEKLIENNKIQTLFEHGMKLLACSR